MVDLKVKKQSLFFTQHDTSTRHNNLENTDSVIVETYRQREPGAAYSNLCIEGVSFNGL